MPGITLGTERVMRVPPSFEGRSSTVTGPKSTTLPVALNPDPHTLNWMGYDWPISPLCGSRRVITGPMGAAACVSTDGLPAHASVETTATNAHTAHQTVRSLENMTQVNR